MHLKGVIQAKPSNRHGRIRVSHEKEACKYVKPSYIDDEAKLDDKDTLDKKSSEDGDSHLKLFFSTWLDTLRLLAANMLTT